MVLKDGQQLKSTNKNRLIASSKKKTSHENSHENDEKKQVTKIHKINKTIKTNAQQDKKVELKKTRKKPNVDIRERRN